MAAMSHALFFTKKRVGMRRTNRRELKEARKRKKITIIFMIFVIYIFICKENLIIVRSVSVYPSYVRHFRSKDFQMLTFGKNI